MLLRITWWVAWSNAAGPHARIIAREGLVSGPEHELTADLMSQYERLLKEVGWNR